MDDLGCCKFSNYSNQKSLLVQLGAHAKFKTLRQPLLGFWLQGERELEERKKNTKNSGLPKLLCRSHALRSYQQLTLHVVKINKNIYVIFYIYLKIKVVFHLHLNLGHIFLKIEAIFHFDLKLGSSSIFQKVLEP